ncbi:uncharacterized protein IL334_002039 [Kwoniella shivajii]|uniref:Autophagy-related protein 11 n=1 Tax=Kwoniella shivajii TaxID=564305 RepID=A0ABZ1CXR3_9TREE|nr:hypothetical protein IL334_002039 [Kwoniella shivajii]
MDIHQASDGGVFLLDRQLEEYDNLDTLLDDIGNLTGVTPNNILLFMEDGREVKVDVLEEAWNSAGPSSPSLAHRLKLYLFNRETFWSNAEQWAAQFQEDIILPPPIDVNQTNSLAHIQHPFLVAHDHLSHLQSLYQAQSRALEIAYSNLSHHLQPLIQESEKFAIRAEKELFTEESLIKGAKVDMTLLPKLTINPSLLRKKKDNESEDKVKTIGDFVNKRKMEQVRDTCRTAHEEHVDRYNQLVGQLDELALSSDAEARGFKDHSDAVGTEFTEGLARLEVAISQLSELLGSGAEDVAQAMRDDLIALTAVKNDFTLEIHLHLQQVAKFQSRIPELTGPLTALDVDLRDKVVFPHLHRLRQLPFAYATVVAEVVRRKEYSRMLLEWTIRLSETLTRFTSSEKIRREQVQAEMITQLPFGVVGLDEGGPRIDISVVTGADGLNGMKFGQEEIEKLVLWVDGLKEDQEVLAALEEGDENYLATLQASIEGLIGKVDFASDELDRMIETSVLVVRNKPRSASNSRTTLNLSTQLRTVSQEKADQEKRIQEMQESHDARLRELEDQYQQRLAVSQTRQAELQDELVRLRTDLSEEMIARQALSAELGERSREQEDKMREQEDQSDFIKGLQAELSQEKDRATDLGVRLQEALLDVDGLKSAEQTLIFQLQELQEERTRSLQSMGEAQLAAHNYESQLAGIRAELEVTSHQLAEAQKDRDMALKNQSAEAERMMRDHIAETDGDRAVLEHQNLTLTKQLEDVKIELDEKLNAVKNTTVRQVDGLKAELNFTKAQLREVQRKETVLADELAMSRDSAMAITQERTYQSDVSRDAVALASKYHETCQRLLNAINNSTTISGSTNINASIIKTPMKTIPTSTNLSNSSSSTNKDELRESVLIRSLVTAQDFDLIHFQDAVTKTIGLVKKWSKSCRQFRDLARNKISFTNFTKGDLALFLPTRNAAARSWAAFNISAPHNFLKVDDTMQEHTKTREWIIARIVRTEEAIATGGESPESNPFGLADGLRYYTHHVEEYNPHTVRLPRRSTSASVNPEKDASISQMLSSTHRVPGPSSGIPELTSDADILSPSKTPRPDRIRSSSGYFPPMSSLQKEDTSDSPEPITENEGEQDNLANKVEQDPIPTQQEYTSSISYDQRSGGNLPNAPTPSPSAAPPTSSAQPIPRKTHSRLPSRGNTPSSPPSRDKIPPSSIVRPSSVASSSNSSYPKVLTIGHQGGKSTLSPAITTSNEDSPSPEDNLNFQKTIRRKESNSALSVSFSPPPDNMKPSPLSLGEGSRRGSKVSSPPPIDEQTTNNAGAGGFSALGTTSASKLIRGFTIGRKSSANQQENQGESPPKGVERPSGKERKPSAMDMLKRFDSGNNF